VELLGLGFGEWAVRLVLGLIVGFCIGMTGIGGGVLGLLSTTLVLKMDPVAAVGTTSLYIFLTNISASYHHARLGNISWKSAACLLGGAVPFCIAVAIWISRQGTNPDFQRGLKWFITGIVFFSLVVMIVNFIKGIRLSVKERILSNEVKKHPLEKYGLSLSLSAVVGALIGATSVGGGVLIVPMLIIVFGLSARQTVGTSIFCAFVLTFITALFYGRGGELDVWMILIAAILMLFNGGGY